MTDSIIKSLSNQKTFESDWQAFQRKNAINISKVQTGSYYVLLKLLLRLLSWKAGLTFC